MGEPEINFDSQWNMATAYFFRMHIAMSWANQCSASGNYPGVYEHLYNLHKELSGQMKPDELARVEELESRARSLVFAKGVTVDMVRKCLYDYEIFLRNIMTKRKMDMPRSKDPAKAILEG